jgi:pyruvate/2-oxoglutarate dehydrogenase complex dihydrolipoamide acyltransferase (E2) component
MRSGQPLAVTTIVAPSGGVIAELMVRQGMTVSAGMTLARINGLGTVWVEAAVPEALAAAVVPGQPPSCGWSRRSRRGAARQGGSGAARGQPRHAHAAGARRGAQPGRSAACRPVRRRFSCSASGQGARRGGARRGGDPHRSPRAGLRGRRTGPLPAGGGGIGDEVDGRRGRAQGAEGRPAGGGLVAVPDRLRGQPEGRRGAAATAHRPAPTGPTPPSATAPAAWWSSRRTARASRSATARSRR